MSGKDRKPRVIVNTRFDESLAQFSPDGRWVAYQTNDSSRFEIVVQAFPDPNGSHRCPPTAVSSRDGAQTAKSSTLSRRTESSWPHAFRRRARTLRPQRRCPCFLSSSLEAC